MFHRRSILPLFLMCFLIGGADARTSGRLQFMEPYSIEGLGVGAVVTPESSAYKRFKCQQSDQYQSAVVCRFREKQGGITSALTILHLRNNVVTYINKSVYPATFAKGEVAKEFERLSERFGAAPKIEKSVVGLIALWGDIRLEPLDGSELASLERGDNPKSGFLIDYMMNFQQSARLGLPVYRLAGGKGYVWIARFAGASEDAALRFLAADPSMMLTTTHVTREPEREPLPKPPVPSPRTSDRQAEASRADKERSGVSTGTGFFVAASGEVITNEHVVHGCKQASVISGLSPPVTARVVAKDAENDLALLKTQLKPAATGALRAGVKIGEDVSVFGYPLVGLLSTNGNFTRGNVSALAGMGDDTRYIQISAPVQPGNSGGAVVDQHGAVVGVVVSKLNALKVAEATKDLAQNVNFAIKTTVLMNFLDSNSVPYQTSNANTPHSSAELAEKAKSFSVLVACE